ncbi:unnamed protein product [Orchesella dallaii]|uniref:Uncharacterized protein n=1 Tax=Orchesella dallaii TaxID=48710 RepID=A0ABP1QRD7_9HEXA
MAGTVTGGDNGRAEMAKKLQEHLLNLDQVEEALKVDPHHEDLLKLKADLNELIVLVSKQMLQSNAATTPCLEVKAHATPLEVEKMDVTSSTTSSASSNQAEINEVAALPNLPSFFYKKWQSKFPQPEPKPSTSTSAAPESEIIVIDTKNNSDNDNTVTANTNEPNYSPRPTGVPKTRNKNLTPEQKRDINGNPSGTKSDIKPGDVQKPSEIPSASTSTLSAAVHVDADKDKNVDVDSKKEQVKSVDKCVTGENAQDEASKIEKGNSKTDNPYKLVVHDSAGNRYTMHDYLNKKIENKTLRNYFKKKLKRLNRQCVNDHLLLQGKEPLTFHQNRGLKARQKAAFYCGRKDKGSRR